MNIFFSNFENYRSELNISNFTFQYLPDYAKFLLENKLDEFVLVAIRFCREIDLPIMRPLTKMPEKDLIGLFRESYNEILTALSKNEILPCIEKKIKNYVTNQINDNKGKKILDRGEIVVEDIILGFYMRRKTFNFFLYSYTQNAVLHMLISNEVDYYTTQEHLLTSKAIISANNEPGALSS